MHERNIPKFDICNIPTYHKMGYTGKGIKIGVLDTPFKPCPAYGKIVHVLGSHISDKFASHGSAVCNVISQIAPDAEIYMLPFGVGSLEWCIDNDMDIVNYSANYAKNHRSSVFENLSKQAFNKGMILLTSAGNYGEENKLRFPGCLQEWIAVGAVRMEGGRIFLTNYSSYTKEKQKNTWNMVEVCGFTDIYVYYAGVDTYLPFGGTSCASPFIAGMAALYFSYLGKTMNAEDFRRFKINNTLDLEEHGFDTRTGYGLFILPELEEQKRMIELWIGKKKYKVNGQEKEMDVAPVIVNDRTMVPIRFVAEAFGKRVDWDDKDRKVTII